MEFVSPIPSRLTFDLETRKLSKATGDGGFVWAKLHWEENVEGAVACVGALAAHQDPTDLFPSYSGESFFLIRLDQGTDSIDVKFVLSNAEVGFWTRSPHLVRWFFFWLSSPATLERVSFQKNMLASPWLTEAVEGLVKIWMVRPRTTFLTSKLATRWNLTVLSNEPSTIIFNDNRLLNCHISGSD